MIIECNVILFTWKIIKTNYSSRIIIAEESRVLEIMRWCLKKWMEGGQTKRIKKKFFFGRDENWNYKFCGKLLWEDTKCVKYGNAQKLLFMVAIKIVAIFLRSNYAFVVC